MARVLGAASASASRGPSSAVQRRARKHKVIMEPVTRERKKLEPNYTVETKAPSGYTYISVGNPQLTAACKERCRKEGLKMSTVSLTPHLNTHHLSRQVNRIGFHFPTPVVAAVCTELGLRLTSTGKAVPFHTLESLGEDSQLDPNAPQEVINTGARDTIKDLFPKIPDHDLFQIIKTSFQKGQGKVGTAFELSLARRAQLAVVAHIRHTYTTYERLLKEGGYREARSAVEQATLDKIIAWRGDDENGQKVLEDVFREVIVISDDEESDLEDETMRTGTRGHSVEFISSRAITHRLHKPPLGENISTQGSTCGMSEEVPQGSRVLNVPAQTAVDRRGFSRYQAWNRALTRARERVQGTEQRQLGDSHNELQRPRQAARPSAIEETKESPRHGDAVLQTTESLTRSGRVPPP
ncbi:hypothetical protein N7468_000131 [Penicillium chermesinum]|uniref:DUF2293 domain-containing protein n=1 Tax=Penicillium chermesinum TaxID=63820 RepID=A0A9W9PLR8_9EURO|nr:uncharacterized protein N7468_000131 [Penicillium chermesinum]KAJ5248680.1 hypothetical protein N7468_000131 [Penicillium chermesinum]